ncbi:MAG: P-II family nitrogen regulator [Prevotellaceae bacterium]|jgi:nitrogen regulatory protein PII 2|nr:P-II family nitrogen regulator [Prevotellaceae bacterium]
MKLILGIIRIAKMGDTKKALADVGLPSFTAMPVLGRGNGHGELEKIREAANIPEAEAENVLEYVSEIPRLKSKRMITLVVTDEKKDLAIETLLKVNSTGKSGDGKIFVVNAFDSIAVHTGVAGEASLD